MHGRRITLAGVLVLGMVAVACGTKDVPSAPRVAPDVPVAPPPVAAPASDAAVPAVPPPIGADDPANLPALAAIAHRIEACPYDGVTFDANLCPDFRTLGDAAADNAADPRTFETLLRLLADEAAVLRYAAAYQLRLRSFAGAPLGDTAKLRAVLAALGKETDPATLGELAALAGRFDLTRTGLVEDLLGVLRNHPRAEARRGLLLTLLVDNGAVPGLFEAVRETVRGDPDLAVRMAALGAFWRGGEVRRADVVGLWREVLRGTDEPLVAHAAYLLGSWQGGVPEALDDVLALTKARAEAGTASFELLAGLEGYVQGGKDSVDPARVSAVAQAVLANPQNRWNARTRALDILARVGGPALASTLRAYVDAPDALVAKRARELLDALPKGK